MRGRGGHHGGDNRGGFGGRGGFQRAPDGWQGQAGHGHPGGPMPPFPG